MDLDRLKTLAGIPSNRPATQDEVHRYKKVANSPEEKLPHPDSEELPNEPSKSIEDLQPGDEVVYLDPNHRHSIHSGFIAKKDKYYTYVTTKNGSTIKLHHRDVASDMDMLFKNKYDYKSLELDRVEKDPQGSFDYYKSDRGL